MTLLSTLLLMAGGVVAGSFGALLGLGGGVFLIPFLVLVLHVPMHEAIATSIISVIATSSTGGAMNVERSIVNIRLGMVLEIVTVIGAIGGGLTASALAGPLLVKIFAIILVVISIMMAFGERLSKLSAPESPSARPFLPGRYADPATGSEVTYSVRNLPGTMAVSLLAGNVSGLLGLGGGIFKVPAMHLISGVPIKAATATSNFMIGVTAAAGAFIYFSEGHLNSHIAAPAVLGVMVGSFLGIRMGRKINPSALKWIFILVLLFASFQLLARST